MVAWGDAERGGDCSKVEDQLYDIQQLAGSGHSALSHEGLEDWPCLKMHEDVGRCWS